ncbi:MAG TPA: sigma-70 family RNA polymerase sigma factor [Blastocatellia bacterium]|jgi:RNA polymerase sigma factor (sigma-70 family)|nr:sigma-70 family RNA polymerase sigma factor [Blastocatellia bacterium]
MGKNKTEIIIETDRVFVIRRPASVILIWCGACNQTSKMATPEDVAAMAGVSLRAIYRAVEAGRVHFNEMAEGPLLVCLNSLGITDDNPPAAPASPRPPAERPVVELPVVELPGRAGGEQNCAPLSPPDQPPHAAGAAAESESARVVEPTARKKDWVLTAEALDKLLTHLGEDREGAGRRYETIRRKLLKFFECRGCLSPEDLADETINRVARGIQEGKEIWVNEGASYFYGVARNVLKEHWGSPERQYTPLDCLPSPAHPYEDMVKFKEAEYDRHVMCRQLESLEKCLQELSPENRELIIGYYQGEKRDKVKNRKDMAERLGIPPNALRIRVHRIRQSLEKRVKDQLSRA